MRRAFGRDYLYERPFMAFLQGFVDSIGCLVRRPDARRFDRAGVRRILVARIDHLGDVFMASSVLPFLKRAFPDAHIDFMAGKWTHVYLRTNRLVDRVIPYNAFRHNRTDGLFKRTVEAVLGYLVAAAKLRRARYDLCINLRTYPFNASILLYLGAPRYSVGFATGGYGFLLDKVVPYQDGVSELSHLVAALHAIGVDAHGLRPRFEPSDEALRRADALLKGLGIAEGERFAVFHTGAGTPVKYWNQGAWDELGARLKREHGLKVLATDPVYNGINSCIALPPLVSFVEYAAVLKRAALFVGLDSFPAHLAASMDTPTVVVWCGVNDPSRWMPTGAKVAVVKKEINCAPCFKKRGCSAMDCMSIGPDECMAAASAFLGGTTASRPQTVFSAARK